MGTASLRELLQSICCCSCWNYAVFWKLQHQSQMLLTWEDGYIDVPTQGHSMESILNNVSIEGLPDMSSSNYESSATLGEDTVGAAVDYMSNIHYPFGNGIVGEVASTGNYCWLSSEDLLSAEFNSKFIPECPDEWMFQFAAGIKTILLVPVIPHGVLQLGSLESVLEDLGMVALIKEMFVNFVENTETLALGREFLAPVISCPNNLSLEMFEEYSNKIMQSDSLMNQALANDNGDDRGHHNVGPFLSFPRDCELHKALGDAVMSNVSDCLWDSSICVEDVYGPSSLLCNGDLIAGIEVREANGGLVYRDDAEHLLEPVVGLAHSNTNSSWKIEGATSSMTSSGIFSASLTDRSQTERSCLPGESTVYHSDVTSGPIWRGRNPTVSSSPAAASYGSTMSELIEEKQITAFSSPNQRKISKVSGASKRKAKSGDNNKPRPRDRQLIQDRLKELRELVPNGAKCSIDGLLDRTVAHMLFLKSVGDRADKLRHWIPQKGVGRKNVKSPKQKDGNQSGTSWAVELGTDQQVCPIIVEDLEYPGHMLIEMVCEENDRFLEIAEVVHGLDLTILKGVMEKRSDNTWAHFVIEAPRGLHRLDIFWPLMKLLQQQQSPISNNI